MRITSKHVETAAYVVALILAAWVLSGCAVQLRTGLEYKGHLRAPAPTLKNTYEQKTAFERKADRVMLRYMGFTKNDPYKTEGE